MRSKLRIVSNSHRDKLKLVHINAQSLNNSNHYDEFCDVFTNSDIDVIGVSETFFKAGSKTDIPNYKTFHVNRSNRGGGGVALFVHEKCKARLLATSTGESMRPEFVIVEVTCDEVKMLVSCVYRPPKVGYLETFLDELYNFLPQYKYSVICGDVNARFGSGAYETKLVCELFDLCDHTCIPYNATYKTDSCSSILDVIASNCPEYVIEHGQCVAPGFSNHDLIYAVLNFKVVPLKRKNITLRNFRKINCAALIADAKLIPWHNIYKCNDIDSKVQLFNDYVLELLDTHAPVKTIKIKKEQPPWMTDEIRITLDERDKARAKSLQTKSPSDCKYYKKLRNHAKQQCRNAKVKYYHEIFKGNKSPSKMWATVRSVGIGKAKQNTADDFPVSANELNEHYLNVSKIEDEDITAKTECYYNSIDCDINNDNLFHFKFVPAHDIKKIIMGMKSNAIGVDGISIQFIKMFLDEIIFVLEHIFNYCLQSSVFPSLWKLANVLPLPKIKNASTCADFRPVNILCVLAKVLEKMVHDQMYDFVVEQSIINPLQSGFRKNHSTTTALVKVADDIRKSIDDRKLTLLVLLDLSKAFDRVNHRLLLIKLSKLGFSISVIRWLDNYLFSRSQRVRCGDEFISEWATVKTGVPQGSVLGPLLFVLYLCDMSDVLKHTKFHFYADDTQIYMDFPISTINEAVAMVNEDLRSLVEYISGHNLCLNVKKTQPIIIGSGFYVNLLKDIQVPLITINGIGVQYCEEVTNLGVLFDSTLSWRQHTNNTVRKVFGTLAQARRSFDCLPPSIRLRIVQCLIMPQIDYGAALFTDIHKYNLDKLQKAENACIRYATNSKRYEHITPHYVNLGLLKVAERRTVSVVTLMWKVLKFQVPTYLFTMFEFSTRHPDLIITPVHRTEKFAKSFRVTASRVFNSLKGSNFLKCINVTAFKKFVKSNLIESY